MVQILLSSCVFSLTLLLTVAWDFHHNLSFTRQHSIVRRNAHINYTNILNFWNEHKNKFDPQDKYDEVVLVMGNTGAGKSTITSALTGKKLNVIERNGYLVIVDEEKRIGTGSSSTTLIPEIMIDHKRNVTYIDCYGFRDNRNITYEISSVYFQNILMNQVENIKFLFVINYESLKINGNKNDFDDLFEHISEFIKDIPKFYDGIALVATKVVNIWKVFRNKPPVLLNDNQSVFNGIADFLKNKKETYLSKTENLEKYRIFANLIDALLQKQNDSYTRIAIFRQPTDEGLLKDLPESKSEIDAIAKMVIDNLHYVKKERDDFGFALSESSKNIVDQIIDDIFKNALMNCLHKMSNEVLTYYTQMIQQNNDIEIIQERVTDASNVISRIKNVNESLGLFQEFLNAANTLNISVSLTNLNTISEDIKKLHFFSTVSNRNENLHMMLFTDGAQRVIGWIEDLEYFYDFLMNLHNNLAAYSSQRLQNDNRIINIITSCVSSTHKILQDIIDLEDVVKEIGSDEIYKKIKTLELNRFQLKHLEFVFSTFLYELKIAYIQSSEKMTVEGYNIKMCDIVKIAYWSQAKIIEIFAMNKIFIDCFIDKTGAETQLFIIAPMWEIIGKPKIILDGKAGDLHKNASAESSSFNSVNGTDGLPGLPGGPAGHFFGVGKEFINAENLEIQANGGKGGPGQHGGNGSYSVGISESHNIEVFGLLPLKASDGGDGGAGSSGGNSGEILIHGLGKSINIKTSQNSGSSGLEGKGGHGGKKTLTGQRVTFTHEYVASLMMSKVHYRNIEWTNSTEVPAGANGKTGSNRNNQKLPTKLILASPYLAINSFKDFVRMNLFENIKESKLRTLLTKLENDDQIKAQYNTLAFIKEFESLENQFLALRYKIDFLPFYNSFLTRVEEFSMSEANPENKKVLSYIYTAALTKVFTLKKKKKGKTVVDLYRYLNTIESSVKEIHEAQHLQIVRRYREDYKNILNEKIEEANDFIQNNIEPEIEKLWKDSDNQMKAIIDEIDTNINSTEDAIVLLEKHKENILKIMKWRAILLPLKIAAIGLSFFGPVGAVAGAVVTGTISVAEGLCLKTESDLGEYKVDSIKPDLKLMPRVTEVHDNKYKLAAGKLAEVTTKLDRYSENLLPIRTTILLNRKEIVQTKNDINKLFNENQQEEIIKKENRLDELLKSQEDLKKEEQNLLKGKPDKTEWTKQTDLKKETKYEARVRVINHIQAGLSGVETISNTAKELENDQGMIGKIDKQISKYAQQIQNLEKMKSRMYDTVIPDIKQIEETINVIKSSVNGSSHAKLDVTKWTVRTTLRDMKSLLQKFTHKMSFELQSNLKRFIEKIDEGFSILIDIYDRIDSYSDSVKQAEYIEHIVSKPITSVKITDSELSNAIIDLRFIIQSNILFEKYEIALHAFKQHYFPFAAYVFQKFKLPANIRFNDTDTLRSNIIEKIKEMRNHIDESKATIGEYSKYIHERKIFNNNMTNSWPFYVWKHDTIKDEIQQLLNGSEILLKADISKGLSYNSIKYNDIGINFNLKNKNLQNHFNFVLKNFALTMTMVGNNYYRCGERYYFISFDDDISISYTLNQDAGKNWIDPNKVYTMIHDSHTFLSPYGMWSIKLESINKSITFEHLKVYTNESFDFELIGQGYYIEQNPDFNFEVCNEYLDTFYTVENIVQILV